MSSDCGYNASPQTYICIPRDIYLVALRANFVVLDKVKVASCNVSSVREAAVFSRAKWRQLVITSSILRARRCLCLSGSGYCELRPAPAGGLTDDCLDTNFIFDVDIKKNLVNADDTMANVSRHADHFVCLFLNSSTLNSINLWIWIIGLLYLILNLCCHSISYRIFYKSFKVPFSLWVILTFQFYIGQ